MPGKSHRGRGRSSTRSKRRKCAVTRVAQSQVAAEAHEPAAPRVPLPGTPSPRPTGVRYPYIATELRRIGVLAGIMLAILVVLALVLS